MIKGIPIGKPAASGRNPSALRHHWNHTAHLRGICKTFHQVSHCSNLGSVILPRAPCVNNNQMKPSYLVPMRHVVLQCLCYSKRWKFRLLANRCPNSASDGEFRKEPPRRIKVSLALERLTSTVHERPNDCSGP